MLNQRVSDEDKKEYIEWFYSCQIDDDESLSRGHFGFCQFYDKNRPTYNCYSHITNIYFTLLSLIVLGDDLKRVNRSSILKGISECQRKDGCFIANARGEGDLRMVYSALCICFLLDDFTPIDVYRAENYILQCLTYEGGFARTPGSEAHGGYTYCAICSLALIQKQTKRCLLTDKQKKAIYRWIYMRLEGDEEITGFMSRPNKKPDSCYSFWLLSSLLIFELTYNEFQQNDECDMSIQFFKRNLKFLSFSQGWEGGFFPSSGESEDILHSFLCLCTISIIIKGNLSIRPIHPIFPISYIDSIFREKPSEA